MSDKEEGGKGLKRRPKEGEARGEKGREEQKRLPRKGNEGPKKGGEERKGGRGSGDPSKEGAGDEEKQAVHEAKEGAKESGPRCERKRKRVGESGDREGGKERGRGQDRFRKNLLEDRKQKGIWLLPKATEDKIYRMKKGMREKGTGEESIRQEVRGFRRREENDYRRKLGQECFRCREPGHRVADCPLVAKEERQGKGQGNICYSCGSSEHRLRDCPSGSDELPFASCYICGKKGHLSRSCSRNKRGIYPMGGSCKQCSSVNHLIKDCPQLEKKAREEDVEVTLNTLNPHKSVDIEDGVEKERDKRRGKKHDSTKRKVVKF